MAHNGKRERSWPTRGTVGCGFVDWWDSEQIEARRQITANAERANREMDSELIERIGREWRAEIGQEQRRPTCNGCKSDQVAA